MRVAAGELLAVDTVQRAGAVMVVLQRLEARAQRHFVPRALRFHGLLQLVRMFLVVMLLFPVLVFRMAAG